MYRSIWRWKMLEFMQSFRFAICGPLFYPKSINGLLILWLMVSLSCSKSSNPTPQPTEIKLATPKKLAAQPPKVTTTIGECWHENLSNKFNFQTSRTSYFSENHFPDSNFVQVNVFSKKTGLCLDTIQFRGVFYFDWVFCACEHVRSYTPGFQVDDTVFDYDYGDFIVEDVNFDGMEDLAIVSDIGGNGGPAYEFYVQDKSQHFHRDAYLSDSVQAFPSTIDRDRKTISTQTHANSMGETRRTFRWKSKTKQWKLIEKVYVPCCPDSITIVQH